MKEALRNYIARELLGMAANGLPRDEDDLLDSGVDSVGVISLVMFIEEQWGVTVPPEDVVIENFQSIERIAAYLATRQGRP